MQNNNIKRTILVASGKGGVGKSTVALNLSFLLASLGFKVGLIDADIYGPSISFMLGVQDKMKIGNNENFIPHEKHGVKFVSMGSLINPGDAVMWRGPMVTKMLYNFFVKTNWGKLDYLIIDTPPGTGDVHISLATKFRIDSSILVTTSQKLAMLDVGKVFYMFKKLSIPVAGIVENMSYQVINGKEEYLFGSADNTISFAEELNIPIITKIPFKKQISESADNNIPAVLDQEIANLYLPMCNFVK